MDPGAGLGVVKDKNIVSLSEYKPQVVQTVAYSLYRPSYLDYCIIITVTVVTLIIFNIVLLFSPTVKYTFLPGIRYILSIIEVSFWFVTGLQVFICERYNKLSYVYCMNSY